jgi:2-polyprenyl-3-methyl-5-hydroxy-6-metoxy-1,4-benzoquinol methylase
MDDKRKLVRAGYNLCAQKYSTNRNLFKSQKYLEILKKLIMKCANILDTGCGSGIPIDKYLLEQGFCVTGIDISREQIKLAKKNLSQGNFLVKDMAEVDFPANSFDAIVSFYSIFHIPREEHPALLKKLYNLMKPDGYLLITMGSGDWEGTAENFHGAKMFWSHYGAAKNKQLVKQAGFEIILEKIDTSGGERHLVILAKKN